MKLPVSKIRSQANSDIVLIRDADGEYVCTTGTVQVDDLVLRLNSTIELQAEIDRLQARIQSWRKARSEK